MAFNIWIETLDAPTFFNNLNLPPASVSPVILNNLEMPAGLLAKTDRQFFHYLRDAVKEEACVDDFVALILRLLDYDDEPDRVMHCSAKTDLICHGRATCRRYT